MNGKGNIAVISMFKRDTEALHLKEIDTEDITTLARSIKGVGDGHVLQGDGQGDVPGQPAVEGQANAARVAEHFGGGGHIHASGFTVYGPYERLIREVPATVEALLDGDRGRRPGGLLNSGPNGPRCRMDGLLIIDKPRGCTSHDVVLEVRRLLGLRRVGHGGTLDPDATGVLLVAARPGDAVLPLSFRAGQGLRGPHPPRIRDGHV